MGEYNGKIWFLSLLKKNLILIFLAVLHCMWDRTYNPCSGNMES